MKIHTERGARIIVDGRVVGRGRGEISRVGPPHTATVVVKAADGRRATLSVKREFTVATFVTGLFTMYTGFFWAWRYPDDVFVPLDKPEDRADAWGGTDPWLHPATNWGPAPPPPARPEPVPDAAQTADPEDPPKPP